MTKQQRKTAKRKARQQAALADFKNRSIYQMPKQRDGQEVEFYMLSERTKQMIVEGNYPVRPR